MLRPLFDESGRPGSGGLLIGLLFAGLLALIGLARVAVGESDPARPTGAALPAGPRAWPVPGPAIDAWAVGPERVPAPAPQPMLADLAPAATPAPAADAPSAAAIEADTQTELQHLRDLTSEQQQEIEDLQRSVGKLRLQLEGHQLEAEVREALATEFRDVLAGQADASRLTDELTGILLAAARSLGAPDDDAPSHLQAMDLAALRRAIPDGVIRQLGYALPRLLQERDLAPGIVRWAACGQGNSRTGTELVIKAIVDGQVAIVDRQPIRDAEDPRVSQAQAEQQERELAFHRAIEAIVGLPIYGGSG